MGNMGASLRHGGGDLLGGGKLETFGGVVCLGD
jgi:hypothetical protein